MRQLWMLLALSVATISIAKEPMLPPTGTKAVIYFEKGGVFDAELLTLKGNILFFGTDTVHAVQQEEIRSLRLHIDEARGWIFPVLLFQAVPSGLLFFAHPAAGAIGISITALTWLSFEHSGPRVNFDRPWTAQDIEELRLHMRHPQELSDEQIHELKKSYIRKHF